MKNLNVKLYNKKLKSVFPWIWVGKLSGPLADPVLLVTLYNFLLSLLKRVNNVTVFIFIGK